MPHRPWRSEEWGEVERGAVAAHIRGTTEYCTLPPRSRSSRAARIARAFGVGITVGALTVSFGILLAGWLSS